MNKLELSQVKSNQAIFTCPECGEREIVFKWAVKTKKSCRECKKTKNNEIMKKWNIKRRKET
jgi:predicted RNA-binding Zn-ribbon protein involved in translation (DUF1610 family)